MPFTPNSGWDVSNLQAWIKNNETMIKNIYSDSPTLERLLASPNSLLNAKSGQHNFNIIDVTSDLKIAACGRQLGGQTPIKNELLNVVKVTDQQLFCINDLEGTFASFVIRAGANPENGYIDSFINDIIEEKLKVIRLGLAQLVWRGDATDGDLFDGIITQGLASTATNKQYGLSKTDVITSLINFWQTVPVQQRYRSYLTMGEDIYGLYIAELAQRNLFQPEANNTSMILGTNARVIVDPALNGSDTVVVSMDEYTILGTDISADFNNMTLSYSTDNRGFYLDFDAYIGVKVVRPEYLSLGFFFANPNP